MRRVAPVWLAGFAFAFCGCLLGIDNLTGGEGPSNDAGENADGSIASDASSSDAELVSDSPISPSPDAGSDSGRFCPQIGALLCDDFDDLDLDADVPGPWDYSYAPVGSAVRRATIISKSAPGSGEIATVSATAASLVKSVAATHIDIAFDLFIQANASNSSILTFTIGAGTLTVKPESATQTTFLESSTLPDGGASYDETGTSTPITVGKWAHVETVVDFPAHLAQLSLDGTQVLQRNLTGAGWIGAHGASVSIGTADSPSTTLFYDNVVIRTD